MKKVASLVAAGAMLLSTYGVAFAWSWNPTVKQTAFTFSKTESVAISGENKQFGGMKSFQMMSTDGSGAGTESITAGNVNVGSGNLTQFALTSSKTSSFAKSGGNTQVGGGLFGHSFQSMGTGISQSTAGSMTVSNVNIDLH